MGSTRMSSNNLRILTFTTLFPNHRFPLHGLFVKARMEEVARLCELEVVAPVPWFPAFRFIKSYYPYSQIQREEWMENLHVSHPRFFLLPEVGKILDGFWIFLGAYRTVKKLQARFPFDLIDAHYAYPDGYAGYLLARAFNKPYTVTIRGSDVNLLPQYPLRRQLIRKTLLKADRVIAVCQALKDASIRLGIPKEKITVIPNGVNPSRFFPLNKQEARKMANLPLNRRIILSVGHLCERKGFHLLIDAMKELIKRGEKDLLLVIVGGNTHEGDFRKYLEERIVRQGLENHVLLAGPKPPDELRVWYSAADLFCLASSREGWPNVCFESLACGVPVIATRVWGTPEVICSPDYGLLVEERSVEALTAKIEQGLKMEWDPEKMVAYARQHSWQGVARKVLEVFESVSKLR